MIGVTLALLTIVIRTRDVLSPPAKPNLDEWSAAASEQTTPIQIPAEDGIPLRGWLVRTTKADAPCVIFFYGSNEDVALERGRLLWLSSLGVNAISVDYRGYGFSGGTVDGDAVRADALTVFDWIKSHAERPDAAIIVYGWSVGTQFAIHVAATRAVAGVILQAPPASAQAMEEASRNTDVPGIFRWAVHLKSDNSVQRIYQGASEAEAVTAPLLIIAGTNDRTVPPAQARAVFEAAASSEKQWTLVEAAGHNDLPYKSPPASTAVETFLHR